MTVRLRATNRSAKIKPFFSSLRILPFSVSLRLKFTAKKQRTQSDRRALRIPRRHTGNSIIALLHPNQPSRHNNINGHLNLLKNAFSAPLHKFSTALKMFLPYIVMLRRFRWTFCNLFNHLFVSLNYQVCYAIDQLSFLLHHQRELFMYFLWQ